MLDFAGRRFDHVLGQGQIGFGFAALFSEIIGQERRAGQLAAFVAQQRLPSGQGKRQADPLAARLEKAALLNRLLQRLLPRFGFGEGLFVAFPFGGWQ